MKKSVVLVVCLLALTMLAYAQREASIGFRTPWGPQFSTFPNSILPPGLKNTGYQSSMLVGILTGINARIPLKKNYLTVEVLYSMRGDRFDFKASQLDGYSITNIISNKQSQIEYYFEYRTHYIEIPVLYSIKVSKDEYSRIAVFFNTGLSLGMNVVSKTIANDFKIKNGSSFSAFAGIDETTQTAKIDQVNPLILNLVGDLDVEFRRRKKTKFFGYARLNQSLTKVYKSESSNPSTGIFSIGFGFGLRWYFKTDVDKMIRN
jgi:hypothetical protein